MLQTLGGLALKKTHKNIQKIYINRFTGHIGE